MNDNMTDKYIEIFPQFEELTGFFATKHGASKGYPYNREDVFEENWLEEAIPVWPKQVHKDNIEVVEQRPYRPLELPDTDGMLTNLRGVLLTTVHADCLPVYLFDTLKNAIGLVHAGWRGTNLGIAPKAVKLMQKEYGSDPADIQVFIGPGIGKCCFEVGEEVYKEFKSNWEFVDEFSRRHEPKIMKSRTCGVETESVSEENAVNVNAVVTVQADAAMTVNRCDDAKYYIDLKGINKRQLMDMGIPPINIETSPHCTCCQPEIFCSYRREGGTYKRMGAGLCLV